MSERRQLRPKVFCLTRLALIEVARKAEAVAEHDREREAYLAYLESPAWLKSPARRAELEAACYRCRLCNRGPPAVRLEVHHRTYRNFGRERVEDLTTLCATCHASTTNMLRARPKYKRR